MSEDGTHEPEPRYEFEADDMTGVCIGDDALLHVLSRYRDRPVVVKRTDEDPFINHYIEESAIAFQTTERP